MIPAFSTLCCMDLTMEQAASLARSSGIGGVEIRLGDDGLIPGYGREDACEMKRIFGGVTILSLNSGITVSCRADPEQILKEGRGCLDLASAAGSRGVRFFAAGGADDMMETAALFSELCRYSEGTGAGVLLETHGDYSSAGKSAALCDLVDHERFRIIWDVCHTLQAGESVGESAEILKGRISHVHLKDALKTDRGYVLTELGKGSVRPEEVISALSETGFDGYISLEWEEYWDRSLRGIYSSPEDLIRSYLSWTRY